MERQQQRGAGCRAVPSSLLECFLSCQMAIKDPLLALSFLNTVIKPVIIDWTELPSGEMRLQSS